LQWQQDMAQRCPYLLAPHLVQWQQEPQRLQQDIQAQQRSFPEVIHALESYGFAAVYVNLRGFPNGGNDLLTTFQNLGYTEMIRSKLGDLVCVRIHPDAHPIRPAGFVN